MNQIEHANITEVELIALSIFRGASVAIERLSSRKRKKISSVDVVFVDNVNGKPMLRRPDWDTFVGFGEVVEALNQGSKPIGFLLDSMNDPEVIEVIECPDLTDQERVFLTNVCVEHIDSLTEEIERRKTHR